MRTITPRFPLLPLILAAGLLVLAGSGDDSDSAAAEATTEEAAVKEDEAMKKASGTGTKIKVRGSEYGRILIDSNRQAIYIFQDDSRNKPVCYSTCAKAWPPVFTKGKPRAGKGVKASLLGTVERRKGGKQVTYNGKPLYFYAHEGPGDVECHNVKLNGGFWWVIGPNGKRRA